MSVYHNQWKKKVVLIFVTCVVLVMMGAGATEFTTGLFRGHDKSSTYSPWLSQWHEQILSELPPEERKKWNKHDTRELIILLRTSSNEQGSAFETSFADGTD